MAGVHPPAQNVSNGAVHGARAAAGIHAQGSQEVSGTFSEMHALEQRTGDANMSTEFVVQRLFPEWSAKPLEWLKCSNTFDERGTEQDCWSAGATGQQRSWHEQKWQRSRQSDRSIQQQRQPARPQHHGPGHPREHVHAGEIQQRPRRMDTS